MTKKGKLNSKQIKWRYILGIATAVLGIGYIWQVNVGATAGFTLRAMEQDIEVLQMEQERLDITIARLQSIDSVSTRVQMLGLTEVQNVQYVTPGQGSVAINR